MNTTIRRLRFPFLMLICAVVVPATSGSAFSSGSPACTTDNVTMAANHGPTAGVSGIYVVQVRRAGNPVTSVLAGETLQVVLSNAQNVNFTGFTLRAQLGSTAGAGVGGLVAALGQQIMTGCSPIGSGLTHTTNTPASSRTANWTVPNTLTPGQQVVFSALVTESRLAWAQLSTTVTVAAPPAVPGLGLVSLVATGASLVGVAAWRLRRR